ncbi:MAG: DUF411 domain-containing protein [Pseudomonadota bacterium]|nr:DUF411 domain-containing protein [Pseudomonadota bacterium]
MPPVQPGRRAVLLSVPAVLLAASCARAEARELTVYKTPWCGCCSGWVAHMRRAGFTAKVVELEDLAPVRQRYGIGFEQSSCHTGVAGGYAIEGHVPPEDVLRLLRERPKARALIVPGMPMGSPGMENPQGQREPYEVLLLGKDGSTRVFARHG